MSRRTPVDAALAVVLAALAGAPGAAAAQEGAGRLSPLDSVKATVAGAEIEVQYGRPSVRGREIFGGLVPFGEVWRTGANEATHVRTSEALGFGDTEVPAGHYTLYTIPGRNAWTLIVNGQTGQWGTEYRADRDVARVPMSVERMETAVDTFTIEVEPGDRHDGVLTLAWETTRARVGFDVLDGAAEGGERD